jgi:predicted nuclease of predicted toxin-antitoxin system
MKVKLGENLPVELVDLLAAQCHDVQTVPGEALAGRPDGVIFRASLSEGRLLMTQDLDFSDVRRLKPGTHPGIVLIRLREPSRRRLVERVRKVLAADSTDTWARCFVVISDRKLRIRRP